MSESYELPDDMLQKISDVVQDVLMTALINDLINVLGEVLEECSGQIDQWGIQSHPDGTGPLKPSPMIWGKLADLNNSEFANAARKRTENDFSTGKGTWEHILTEEVFEAYAEDDTEKLRAELKQVAAVAVSWINAIDRRKYD